jgi:hypothetical protein
MMSGLVKQSTKKKKKKKRCDLIGLELQKKEQKKN